MTKESPQFPEDFPNDLDIPDRDAIVEFMYEHSQDTSPSPNMSSGIDCNHRGRIEPERNAAFRRTDIICQDCETAIGELVLFSQEFTVGNYILVLRGPFAAARAKLRSPLKAPLTATRTPVNTWLGFLPSRLQAVYFIEEAPYKSESVL